MSFLEQELRESSLTWTNGPDGFYSYSNCGYNATLSSYLKIYSFTLDNCGNLCAANSSCSYFTYSGTTCTFLTLASPTIQPVAYPNSTQSCGSVVKRVPVAWTNGSGGYYSSSNCGYASESGYEYNAYSPFTFEDCANLCASISACNYFTFKGNVCKFLTFASPTVKPVAYVDSTQMCGSVVSRPNFDWQTDGLIQISSNCDVLIPGPFGYSPIPGSITLDDCIAYCEAYPDYCNFFTLSTDGVCTLKKSSNLKITAPFTIYSSANSNCGYVPSEFTG